MAWTVQKNAAGEIEANDGGRVRAMILNRRTSSLPWSVYRVSSTGTLGGADSFRTLAAAKEFCRNNAGVWGKSRISDAAVKAYIRLLSDADRAACIE